MGEVGHRKGGGVGGVGQGTWIVDDTLHFPLLQEENCFFIPIILLAEWHMDMPFNPRMGSCDVDVEHPPSMALIQSLTKSEM